MRLGPTSTKAAPVLSLSKNISYGRKKLDIGIKLLLKHQTCTWTNPHKHRDNGAAVTARKVKKNSWEKEN